MMPENKKSRQGITGMPAMGNLLSKSLLTLTLSVSIGDLLAQSKVNQNSVPNFDFEIRNQNKTLLLPEFFEHRYRTEKDTVWEYKCYNSKDSLISLDTLTNTDGIRYYSLFKSYTDSSHKYVDANGKKQFLPVSSIIARYDKMGTDKWMYIDYATNKFLYLKEYKSDILRSDKIVMPASKHEPGYMVTYKYYRVGK